MAKEKNQSGIREFLFKQLHFRCHNTLNATEECTLKSLIQSCRKQNTSQSCLSRKNINVYGLVHLTGFWRSLLCDNVHLTDGCWHGWNVKVRNDIENNVTSTFHAFAMATESGVCISCRNLKVCNIEDTDSQLRDVSCQVSKFVANDVFQNFHLKIEIHWTNKIICQKR